MYVHCSSSDCSQQPEIQERGVTTTSNWPATIINRLIINSIVNMQGDGVIVMIDTDQWIPKPFLVHSS